MYMCKYMESIIEVVHYMYHITASINPRPSSAEGLKVKGQVMILVIMLL